MPASLEAVRRGRGLHRGNDAQVTFRRSDGTSTSGPGDGRADGVWLSVRTGAARASARLDEWTVTSTERGTSIAQDSHGGDDSDGDSGGLVTLATVEHLFAALAAYGIRSGLSIDVDGDEAPLLDGGSRAWCDALAELSLAPAAVPLVVTAAAEIAQGDSVYRFAPGPSAASDAVSVAVDFRTNDPSLESHAAWEGSPSDFRDRIASARTFGFARELGWLLDRGLAQHVAPESVVLLNEPGESPLASGRAFTADEPARHKLLDLIGDLYLYGGPPRGSIEAVRPGHSATHAIVREALRRGVLQLAPSSLAVFAFAVVVVFLTLLAPRAAHASPYDDPYSLPEAPRPPTLPELTHSEVEATLESTLGILVPNAANASAGNAVAYVQRLAFEIPIRSRNVFVGASFEAAAGDLPNAPGATRFVSGNTELYGRTVWATRAGLAFGGQLGVMLPTASFGNSGSAASTALAAATIRPWDNAFFNANTIALRPAIDVRAFDNGFVVQFREGIDWAGSTVSSAPRTGLAAVSGVFGGYKFGELLSAGVEAYELYMIHGAVDDGSRAVFTFSPMVRILTPIVQPAISGVFSLHDTVAPTVSSAYGIRISFTVALDRSLPDSESNAPTELE